MRVWKKIMAAGAAVMLNFCVCPMVTHADVLMPDDTFQRTETHWATAQIIGGVVLLLMLSAGIFIFAMQHHRKQKSSRNNVQRSQKQK